MNFKEYQKRAGALEKLWAPEDSLVYAALSIAGEAGEVTEKVKKIVRDDKHYISQEKKVEIAKEIGDVLWGLSCLCDVLQLSLDDVAVQNLDKLESREKRNQLGGSGDNR